MLIDEYLKNHRIEISAVAWMLTKDFAPYYILLIVFADYWTSLLRDPFTTNFFSQQTLFSTLQSKSLKRRKSLGLFFFILKTVIRWNFSTICIRTFWWDNSTDSLSVWGVSHCESDTDLPAPKQEPNLYEVFYFL